MRILPLYVEKVFPIIETQPAHNDPLSAPAWYMYEYLLTLHLEVAVIWKSKFSLTTILFLINRYAFLLYWSSALVLDILFTQNIQVSSSVTKM